MARRSTASDLLPIAGIALGLIAASRLDQHRRAANQSQSATARHRPGHRVVILGAGFDGLSAALPLSKYPDIDLTVIDLQNHHLFQPLLYQVATAALSPADIASPVRDIIPAAHHTRVIMGSVTGIDPQAHYVVCDGQRVCYDELVIATGSQPSYFGNDAWERYAPGLKTLHDALDLRGRILLALEHAGTVADPAERDQLLTFVLIGGGPTGVEMAGSIAELTREMLALDHGLSREQPRIILIEAGERVLAEFPEDLSGHAAASLRKLGVEIRTGAKVTMIEDGLVHLAGEVIPSATIIWAAGTAATPVAAWLGIQPGKGGRVAVGADLRVPGHPDIHVVGDAALALDAKGKPLPALAPVAKQQGDYVSQAIIRRVRGLRAPARFRYWDYGTLATIGRAKAVAKFGPLHITGLPAWLLWAVAHIFFLIGFRNRLMVSAQWAFAFATDRRPGRLISWSPAAADQASTRPADRTQSLMPKPHERHQSVAAPS